MRIRFAFPLIVLIAFALNGCAGSDPVPSVDAGRTDAGRVDAGRDLGVPVDLGADLGPVDLGAPDLGSPDLGPPGAAGETCASAVAITDGTITGQSTTGYTNNYESGLECRGTAGLDRVYSISVPAGQRLSALVSSNSTSDLSVSVLALADCEAAERHCIDSSDVGGTGQADIAFYDNTSGTAVVVAIIVDNYSSSDIGGGFDLVARLTPIPTAGDTCGAPTVIGATGGTLTPETLVGYDDNYTSTDSDGCFSMRGSDHVYSITVMNGQTLTVSVAPFGTWDPSLNIIVGDVSSCGADPLTCAQYSDSGGEGAPDSLNYDNASGSDQTVFIVIDSYDSRQGTYTLTTSVHPT